MTTGRAGRRGRYAFGPISAPASIYYKVEALFCSDRDQRGGDTSDRAAALTDRDHDRRGRQCGREKSDTQMHLILMSRSPWLETLMS